MEDRTVAVILRYLVARDSPLLRRIVAEGLAALPPSEIASLRLALHDELVWGGNIDEEGAPNEYGSALERAMGALTALEDEMVDDGGDAK